MDKIQSGALGRITDYHLLRDLECLALGIPRDYAADIQHDIASLEGGVRNPQCYLRAIRSAIAAGNIPYEQIGYTPEQLDELCRRSSEVFSANAARSIPRDVSVSRVVTISSSSPVDGAFYGHGIG